MSTLQKLVLTLVLLLTGLLAGLQTLMLMGVLPGMARMPLATYVGMWEALDHFFAARMPILVNATLVPNRQTIVSFSGPQGEKD